MELPHQRLVPSNKSSVFLRFSSSHKADQGPAFGFLKKPVVLTVEFGGKMGIDIHTLNFLKHVKNRKSLGDTVTIGRQGLYVSDKAVRDIVRTKPNYQNKPYCEELLTEYFGANFVQSIDNSGYEDATHIHNMNKPIPEALVGKFDTIIDGGCLEHIFDISQAFANCSLLCKPGGQIIHILPANNYCGHGFWQFSPELFFSLYSAENGYRETEVFLADMSDIKKWYRVHEPKNGKRVNVMSSNALYVMVRTVRSENRFQHSDVQQSDYVYTWEGQGDKEAQSTGTYNVGGIKNALKNIPIVYKLSAPLYQFLVQTRGKAGLNGNNPGLASIDVTELVNA